MKKEIPDLDNPGLRQFALVFSAIVAGLFGIVMPLLFGHWSAVPWIVAVGVTLWGLLAPSTVRPFYRIWMRLGMIMNAITTPVILGVVYYAVVLPYGVVLRLLGKDPMTRRWGSSGSFLPLCQRETRPLTDEETFLEWNF